MLCDECGKNEATVAVTVTAGDEITKRHLCPECMKKMELSLGSGDIQSFLSSVLSVLSHGQTQKTQPVCSACGLKYAEFEKTGKLGCAQCYHDFAAQLEPVLQRIHGRAQHAGRKPAGYHAPAQEPQLSETMQRMDDLRQKMEQAVAAENFEDAAKYRDELRLLAANGEAQA